MPVLLCLVGARVRGAARPLLSRNDHEPPQGARRVSGTHGQMAARDGRDGSDGRRRSGQSQRRDAGPSIPRVSQPIAARHHMGTGEGRESFPHPSLPPSNPLLELLEQQIKKCR